MQILLDRSQPQSLTAQIVDQIRDAIRCARIGSGARLPSSRRLSEQLAISRNTVIRAYDLLLMEALVESRPASGLYVAEQQPRTPATANFVPSADDPMFQPLMPMPLRPRQERVPQHLNRSRLLYDFHPGRAAPDLFPLKTWRRLLQANLSHGGASGLTLEGEPAGLASLRTAIANHLASARGIIADPGRIVILSDIQEGISIASRLFLARGTLGVVEQPGARGATRAFEAAGAEIAAVAVDRQGLDPRLLPKRTASLLYLTPSHQYPTGATLSAARRTNIIEWARRHGCYIIEDDYDCDIRYTGSNLMPLAALAPDCTIYLGSFAKTLGAGLRLAYMVAPERIADAVCAEKAVGGSGNSWLEQATLADFMHSGSYAAHLLRVRSHYRDRRDCLIGAMRRNFGDVAIDGADGGLHLLWHLPPGIPDATAVESLALRARIGVHAFASAQVYVRGPTPLGARAIILGFAALSPKQIEKGIARLSDAIDDAIDDPETDMTAFFSDQPAPPSPAWPLGKSLVPPLRQRPVLRKSSAPRASLREPILRQGSASMPVLKKIYCYPIKGLSAQPLTQVEIAARMPLPHDRSFALVRPGAPYDVGQPKWGKKGLFVMLMLEEALARVRTNLDLTSMQLTIAQDDRVRLVSNLNDDAARAEVEQLFWQLLPAFRAPPTLVRSGGGHFMDKPDNVISLINLATVRSLEQLWGIRIDPLRFRANFYIDGARPWEEFDWVGSDIRIGDGVFHVDRRNGRCGATNVDPHTGRRDLDLPASLRAAFGHKELGIYLIAKDACRLSAGAAVATPDHLRTTHLPVPAPLLVRQQRDHQKFICGGCYYIYDPEAGIPEQAIAPATSFAAIPMDWRCPDCGTDKSTYRPYVKDEPRAVGSARVL